MKAWETRYIERKLGELATVNRAPVERFLRYKRSRLVKDATLKTYLGWIALFEVRVAKPLGDATADDFTGFFEHLNTPRAERPAYGGASVGLAAATLKLFYRWLLGDYDRPRSFWSALRVPEATPTQLVEPLTEPELNRLLAHCRTVRDRALVALLADSGFRRHELAALRVGDVEFDDASGGAWVRLEGEGRSLKSGPRKVFVVRAAPFLRDHLISHPSAGDPNSPLFCSQSRRSATGMLSANAISLLVRHLYQRAGTRRVHPHMFRHTRATEAARNNWGDAKMRLFFGWKEGSRTPHRYIHLRHEDLRAQVLADATQSSPLPVFAPPNPFEEFSKSLIKIAQWCLRESRSSQPNEDASADRSFLRRTL